MAYYQFFDEKTVDVIGSITISNPKLETLREYGYNAYELTYEPEPVYDTVNQVLEIRFRIENDKIVQYYIILPANNDIEMP